MADEAAIRDESTKPKHADRSAPEFWIISDHRFFEQPTLDRAVAERVRLSIQHPSKNFGIYRCKRRLDPSTTKATIVALKDALHAFMLKFANAEKLDEGTELLFEAARIALRTDVKEPKVAAPIEGIV